MSDTTQVLRGATATITRTLVDQNGSPRDFVDGTVSATVRRADGSVALPSTIASKGDDTGEAVLALPATATERLDRLRVEWREGTTVVAEQGVEVVGGYYFTLPECRKAGPNMNDPVKYPDSLVIAARRAVEDECERITGRAFVPRYNRVILDGPGGMLLGLPHPDVRRILSVSVDNRALSTGELEHLSHDAAGHLINNNAVFTFGRRNVVVEYEHGADAPPARIKTAALLRLRDVLSTTKLAVPDRATFQVIEGKVFGVAQPGRGGSRTGIFEVDAAYNDYAFSRGRTASVPVV